jgi:hypothetical protein
MGGGSGTGSCNGGSIGSGGVPMPGGSGTAVLEGLAAAGDRAFATRLYSQALS